MKTCVYKVLCILWGRTLKIPENQGQTGHKVPHKIQVFGWPLA